MATIEMVFTAEEIHRKIPYHFICQTRYGSIWNTMRRKLKWNNEFSEDEKVDSEKIFRRAYNWSVGNGVPESVRMNLKTYFLWNKIEKFCSELNGGLYYA